MVVGRGFVLLWRGVRGGGWIYGMECLMAMNCWTLGIRVVNGLYYLGVFLWFVCSRHVVIYIYGDAEGIVLYNNKLLGGT